MRRKQLVELDGIRALAALLVIYFHFAAQINGGDVLSQTIKKFSSFGQTGVTLFFVLSGFLITRILFQSRENDNYFKNFYIRRALRIFPLYYLALLVYLFFLPAWNNEQFSFSDTWYFWVYLQNFAFTFDWHVNGPNHFWSLAVEEHFYLFWPLLLYYARSKRSFLATIAALIILSLITRVVLYRLGYHTGIFYFTFTNLDALAVGALMAAIELNGFTKTSHYYFGRFVLFFTPSIVLGVLTTGKQIEIVQYIKAPLMALSYYFLIIYAIKLKPESYFKALLQSKPLRYTGKISYGLYVYHPLCFALLANQLENQHWVVKFIIEASAMFLLSSLSFYFFENWFLKLKEGFGSRPQKNKKIAETTGQC